MNYEDRLSYIKNNMDVFRRLYPNVMFKNVRFRKRDSRYQLWIVWDNGNKVSTIGRFNLEIKLGRLLSDEETCDHIDGNSTNDNVDNLQVLSRIENSIKGSSLIVKARVSAECSKRMLSSSGDYCRGSNNNFAKLTEEQVKEIKKEQLNYVFGSAQDSKLAEKYNVSRSIIRGIRHGKSWKHITV